MIANDENSGAQIEFEPNGEAGIFIWKLDGKSEVSYDVYDEHGNVMAKRVKCVNQRLEYEK